MSVYSGFATRQLETVYNTTVCHMLKTLQKFVLATLNSEPIDLDKWNSSFTKHFRYLCRLEDRKHLQPKYSNYCIDLAQFLEIKEALNSPHNQTLLNDTPTHLINTNELHKTDDKNTSQSSETENKVRRTHSELKRRPNLQPDYQLTTQKLIDREIRERPPIGTTNFTNRSRKSSSSRVYFHSPNQSVIESPQEISSQDRYRLPPSLSRRGMRRAEYDRSFGYSSNHDEL